MSQNEKPTEITNEARAAIAEILNGFWDRVKPDRMHYDDEPYVLIEWMHSPSSIVSVEVEQTTGETFWAGRHNGEQVCGKGPLTPEAWDMIIAVSRLGICRSEGEDDDRSND